MSTTCIRANIFIANISNYDHLLIMFVEYVKFIQSILKSDHWEESVTTDGFNIIFLLLDTRSE